MFSLQQLKKITAADIKEKEKTNGDTQKPKNWGGKGQKKPQNNNQKKFHTEIMPNKNLARIVFCLQN